MNAPTPPILNTWLPQIAPCASAGLLGTKMEAVAVTATNTLAPLSLLPSGDLFLLIVNGTVFTPVDPQPQFSLYGQLIQWTGGLYAILPGSSVVAVYSTIMP